MSDSQELGLIPDQSSPPDPHGLGLIPDAPSALEQAGQLALATGRHGAKALDYQRGVGFTAMDRIAQAMGRPSAIPAGQTEAILNPLDTQTAPSYREGFKTWGVPPDLGASQIPKRMGLLSAAAQAVPQDIHGVSLRDAVGTEADAVGDPMTYESGGLGKIAAALKDVPGAGTVAKGLSYIPSAITSPLKAGANALYDSGIRPIIQAGERFGNENVGNTMRKYGIWGSPPSIESGMEKTAGALKTSRDAILSEADAAGGAASKNAAYTPMFQQLQELVKDQRLTPDQASRILSNLTEAKQVGGDTVAPSLMSQWKTDVGNALPGSTWDELSKVNPTLANDVKFTTQRGLRQETENAVGRVLPDQVGPLKTQNQELGDLINPDVQRAANTMSTSYERKPIVSTGDLLYALAGVGAGGLIKNGHTAEAAIGAVGVKKLIEAARSTALKTGAGLLGDRVLNSGAAPLIDAASRQTAVGLTRKSPYVVPAEPKQE